MPFELLIALRYLLPRRRGGLASAQVTALVAVVGLACGVAALVVAMALANGFRDEMRDKILGGTAHVTVARADGSAVADWRALAARLRAVEGVNDAAPTSYAGALLSGPGGSAYALLRGVEPASARDLSEIRRSLAAGSVEELSRPSSESYGPPPELGAAGRGEGAKDLPVVVGAELAARTGLDAPGARGWVLAGGEFSEASGFRPRALPVRVVGVFRSGLFEYDSAWAYVPLAGACAVGGCAAGSAPALSVETADIYRAPETAGRVRAALGAGYAVVDWREANRPLFAALELERRTVSLIVALIVLVAALNITTTLVLVVVERRADIAVLGAMGARARSVMAVFVIEGAIVGAVGAGVGVALGLAACLVGDRYELVRLPAEVYSLGSIPFHPRAFETASAALAAFAVCVIATLYPARRAARLRPADALRYE